MSDADADLDLDLDLERQVAATLAAHARDLAVEPRPFEPVHPSLDLGGGDPAGPPPRSSWSSFASSSSSGRRRLAWAVAASVLVVAGVTGVAVGRGGDEDVRLGAVPGVPEDALIPTWDGPDGWELSGFDWDIIPDSGEGVGWYAGTVQLLGDPADSDRLLDRALLIEIGGGGIAEAPQRTTVRGQPGQWGPDPRNPTTNMLLWDEEVGVHMRAAYRGLTTPEVVAILDSLTLRPGGVQAGFDLPPDGLPNGLVPLAEASDLDPASGPTAVRATFGWRVPEETGEIGEAMIDRERYKAQVETVSPAGRPTPAYITAWFIAGRDADQVVRWWYPTNEEGVDGGFMSGGILQTITPTGDAVTVIVDEDAVVTEGLGDPEDVARDITESVAPATSDHLTEVSEGLLDQWMARELVVAVPTPAGTVELRGRGAESVLCLHDDGALSCAAAEHPDMNTPLDSRSSDGQWMATVPTEEGDQLLAVSDKGPILMEVTSYDDADEAGEREQVFTYPDPEAGEADGFWAAVLANAVGHDTGPGYLPADVTYAQPITDVAREADACLSMLASDISPDEVIAGEIDTEGGRPEEADRIRAEGGGAATMYQACRELVGDS